MEITQEEANLIDFIAMNIPGDLLSRDQWSILSMLDARIIGVNL